MATGVIPGNDGIAAPGKFQSVGTCLFKHVVAAMTDHDNWNFVVLICCLRLIQHGIDFITIGAGKNLMRHFNFAPAGVGADNHHHRQYGHERQKCAKKRILMMFAFHELSLLFTKPASWI